MGNEYLNKYGVWHINYVKHLHVHPYASRKLTELVLFTNVCLSSMIFKLFFNFFVPYFFSPFFCLTGTYLVTMSGNSVYHFQFQL